jgi:hypothetical protein
VTRRWLKDAVPTYTLWSMHSLSNERRQARKRRRHQVRRRRLAALFVAGPLVILAIWAAYALPATSPARVPAPGAVDPFGQASGVDRRLVVARVGDVDLLIPVKVDATTAVAFHPVDNPNSVELTPVGERGDASGVATRLGDIFKSGGGMLYYVMDGDGSDGSSATAGIDVGAVPGAFVYSPVDGRVVGVKDYELLGRYDDTEIQIQLADDPSVLLVITHVAKSTAVIGSDVKAGETALGRVREFPADFEQSLKQYTNDAGDHVQLIALRVTPQLSGY